MSQQGKTFRYDVVILGGGPAGAAALSLRRHAPALSVALEEQTVYDAPRVGETLPPTVQAVLEQLGVWGTFVRGGGDAATTFDPLSSRGILKSLRPGVLASYAVADHFKGVTTGLEKYEALTAREFDAYLSARTDFSR